MRLGKEQFFKKLLQSEENALREDCVLGSNAHNLKI